MSLGQDYKRGQGMQCNGPYKNEPTDGMKGYPGVEPNYNNCNHRDLNGQVLFSCQFRLSYARS